MTLPSKHHVSTTRFVFACSWWKSLELVIVYVVSPMFFFLFLSGFLDGDDR